MGLLRSWSKQRGRHTATTARGNPPPTVAAAQPRSRAAHPTPDLAIVQSRGAVARSTTLLHNKDEADSNADFDEGYREGLHKGCDEEKVVDHRDARTREDQARKRQRRGGGAKGNGEAGRTGGRALLVCSRFLWKRPAERAATEAAVQEGAARASALAHRQRRGPPTARSRLVPAGRFGARGVYEQHVVLEKS